MTVFMKLCHSLFASPSRSEFIGRPGVKIQSNLPVHIWKYLKSILSSIYLSGQIRTIHPPMERTHQSPPDSGVNVQRLHWTLRRIDAETYYFSVKVNALAAPSHFTHSCTHIDTTCQKPDSWPSVTPSRDPAPGERAAALSHPHYHHLSDHTPSPGCPEVDLRAKRPPLHPTSTTSLCPSVWFTRPTAAA